MIGQNQDNRILAGADDHLTRLSPVILNLESTGLTHLESEIREVSHCKRFRVNQLEITPCLNRIELLFTGIPLRNALSLLP